MKPTQCTLLGRKAHIILNEFCGDAHSLILRLIIGLSEISSVITEQIGLNDDDTWYFCRYRFHYPLTFPSATALRC